MVALWNFLNEKFRWWGGNIMIFVDKNGDIKIFFLKGLGDKNYSMKGINKYGNEERSFILWSSYK